MKLSKPIVKNLLIAITLILATSASFIAHADKNSTYYFDRHDRAYTQPQHQYKRQNNRNPSWLLHYGHKHHHIYNQNRGYYKRLYQEHIKRYLQPKTRHIYGRNYSNNRHQISFDTLLG